MDSVVGGRSALDIDVEALRERMHRLRAESDTFNTGKGEGADVVARNYAVGQHVVTSHTRVQDFVVDVNSPHSEFPSLEEVFHGNGGVNGQTNNTDTVGLDSISINQVEEEVKVDAIVQDNTDIFNRDDALAVSSLHAKSGDKAHFRYIEVENVNADGGVVFNMPSHVVNEVNARFENTLYGYFLGKRLAFPVVEYYAKQNWGKYGLVRIMLNDKGFFFFKFNTKKGVEDVLENGSWLIRRIPIVLKQ